MNYSRECASCYTGFPVNKMAEPDPDSLLHFLSSEKVDLARFYEDFRKLGVKRVQHLEDVREQDYVKIGLTDVEIRRIKRRWEKQLSKKRGIIHNFRKLTTVSKAKKRKMTFFFSIVFPPSPEKKGKTRRRRAEIKRRFVRNSDGTIATCDLTYGTPKSSYNLPHP